MSENKMFEVYDDSEEYLKKICLNSTKEIKKVPIFIGKKRKDLKSTIDNYFDDNIKRAPLFKTDVGLIISDEVNFYKNCSFFCEKWIHNLNEMSDSKTLLIIGIYKDFSQKKVLDILEFCKEKEIEIFLLVGRDLSSLSWLIAKQFFYRESGKMSKAIFSHKNLSIFSEKAEKWDIFDIKKLEKQNIKNILEEEIWSELAFHGHGKEDHLNLADFTLHGYNRSLVRHESFAPSWGHRGQQFFKDETKAIRISSLNVDKLFLLSCSNFPFYDCRLYDTNFNLTLDAIDGFARNIIASTGVQSVDNPELDEILNDSNTENIGVRLHNKLNDIQPFVSIVNIGLPNIFEKVNIKNTGQHAERLEAQTKIILSRLSSYVSSGMLSNEHPIKKLSRSILLDYSQLTRRGTYGTTKEEYSVFEQNLINRVNPLSKKIADIMMNNQSDELFEFDSYNIYRSELDKKSIKKEKCCCGCRGFECNYIPETQNLFNIQSHYCYKCGDKTAIMAGMPDIEFTCDEYDVERLKIHYKIQITPKSKGDVFLGVQLPTYVEKSVDTPSEIKKIRFKALKSKVVEGDIYFKEDTLLQSYYLKLFVIQNGGIGISRCFFNLVNNSKEK